MWFYPTARREETENMPRWGPVSERHMGGRQVSKSGKGTVSHKNRPVRLPATGPYTGDSS